MSMGVNKAILIGHIGTDINSKDLTGGGKVFYFNLCTEHSWNDKTTGEKKEIKEWHRIVAYNNVGELIGKYSRKGDKIYIEGRIKNRKYEKDGVEKYATEIDTISVNFLAPKRKEDNEKSYNNTDEVFDGF